MPTGPSYDIDAKRTKKAYEEGKENKGQVYLISGRIDKPLKTSQVYSIYKQLRGYDIHPRQMLIEGKSANTLENVLFSLEKLKKRGAHDIGIASSPIHLDRFEYIIKKAKEKGIIDKNFRVHRLETDESFKEWFYGVLANLKEKYRLRKGIPKR
ncbi:MAG: YdcF family protein [Candidatus Pacearchaeota archaeon]|nr:YdcF family protein [Candidatus Pacearchaeota archaeon]